jgi:hypothetical protein
LGIGRLKLSRAHRRPGGLLDFIQREQVACLDGRRTGALSGSRIGFRRGITRCQGDASDNYDSEGPQHGAIIQQDRRLAIAP